MSLRNTLRPAFVLFALALAACPAVSRGPSKPAPAHGVSAAKDGGGPVSLGPTTGDVDPGVPLKREEICARTPLSHAAALSGKKPFRDLDPHCGPANAFCDTVDKSPDPKATCFVANDNITRAERESRVTKGTNPSTSAAWDGTKPPKYLDRIDAHLHLTRAEHEKLKNNRFVVLDRLAFTDYASAFHEVFQEELPLFVGIDPILHAVFRGTELALERVETKTLQPALGTMLKKLRGNLVATPMDAETRSDLDIYLGVAAALLNPPAINYDTNKPKTKTKLSALAKGGDEVEIQALVDGATHVRSLTEVKMFGRPRMIDFSQLEPRGHYATNGFNPDSKLDTYFQAMMWLSRLELNLVSRSCRSSHPGPSPDTRETPREIKAALALADLVERSGATTELRQFEEVYTSFAGKREDVSPTKLLEIARANGIRASDTEAPDKLKTAIGEGFKRTARTHFTIEAASVLPVIMTMFGPRIVPDVAPLTRVVHDEVLERKWLGAADAGFILGHDRARSHITDFGAFPGLSDKFKNARDEMRKNATAANDVYGSWLRSVLAIADKPTGVVPSFTKSDAYADHRLNSALVGYGQIRHAFVLLAAQGYDAYGCEIPDAYVEPLPAVYDALLSHVRGMRSRASATGWSGLERVLAMLASVAHDETSGRLLTEPQRRWLAMVSEFIPNGGYVSTGEPPKWTGWYFDMFEDREHGATLRPSFIADYFTLTNAGKVAYLGAEGPRLAVFIVDTNGEPRAMVGPVAKGFEAHAPIEGRLNDEKVFDTSAASAGITKKATWRASYAVAEQPEPPLGLEGQIVRCGDDLADDDPQRMYGFTPTDPNAPKKPKTPAEWRVAIRSTRATAGPTTITLLDHHADPLTAKLTINVGREWTVAVFDLPPELAKAHFGVEAIHVRVEDLAYSKTGTGPFDYSTTPSVFRGTDYDSKEKLPSRPQGPGYFTVGLPPRPETKQPPKPPAYDP